MKGGSKPTYSQYQRTIKNTSNKIPKLNIESTKDSIPIKKNPIVLERQMELNKLKEFLATPKNKDEEEKLPVMRKFKKTIKIYKLGKNKKKWVF